MTLPSDDASPPRPVPASTLSSERESCVSPAALPDPAARLRPRDPSRHMLTLASFVVIVAGLKIAEPFLVPVVTGVMVAAVSSPLVTWLVRKGAPPILGAAAVLVLDIAVLGGIARLLLLAASDFQGGLPSYVSKLSALSRSVEHYLNRQGLHEVADAAWIHADQAGELIQGVVGNFASVASHVAVVIFVVFFALCEIGGMGDKLRALTNDAEAQFERVDRIVRQVQLYLVVKFWTSLIAGAAAFIVLKAVGVQLALLLALSLFLLHFIPNVGTAIATMPAVLFALADRGPAAALTVGVAYLSINTLVGNLLEPRMLGTRLGMSPFVVLLGMLFWGWLWGPLGALLAVPILVATKIVLENIPAWAWLGALADSPTKRPLDAQQLDVGRVSTGFGLGADGDDQHLDRMTRPGFRVRKPLPEPTRRTP
jgi:AI-2 transport protein TqsA